MKDSLNHRSLIRISIVPSIVLSAGRLVVPIQCMLEADFVGK